MNDSITFFIALGLVFLVLRWLLGQGGGNEQRRGTTRSRNQVQPSHAVRQEQVQMIQSMFPDINEAAIRADLARTGSPVITSDNILRNGGTLPMPQLDRDIQNTYPTSNTATGTSTATAFNRDIPQNETAGSARVSLNTDQAPLVNRLCIGKDSSNSDPLPPAPPKVWEADSDRRADVLRKRKEFMLLEARRRYLEKQQQNNEACADTSAAGTS